MHFHKDANMSKGNHGLNTMKQLIEKKDTLELVEQHLDSCNG